MIRLFFIGIIVLGIVIGGIVLFSAPEKNSGIETTAASETAVQEIINDSATAGIIKRLFNSRYIPDNMATAAKTNTITINELIIATASLPFTVLFADNTPPIAEMTTSAAKAEISHLIAAFPILRKAAANIIYDKKSIIRQIVETFAE